MNEWLWGIYAGIILLIGSIFFLLYLRSKKELYFTRESVLLALLIPVTIVLIYVPLGMEDSFNIFLARAVLIALMMMLGMLLSSSYSINLLENHGIGGVRFERFKKRYALFRDYALILIAILIIMIFLILLSLFLERRNVQTRPFEVLVTIIWIPLLILTIFKILKDYRKTRSIKMALYLSVLIITSIIIANSFFFLYMFMLLSFYYFVKPTPIRIDEIIKLRRDTYSQDVDLPLDDYDEKPFRREAGRLREIFQDGFSIAEEFGRYGMLNGLFLDFDSYADNATYYLPTFNVKLNRRLSFEKEGFNRMILEKEGAILICITRKTYEGITEAISFETLCSTIADYYENAFMAFVEKTKKNS